MTTISFLPKRKAIKQGVWKTLNVVVGVVTILNVSMIGALVAPKTAYADTSAIQYTLEGQRKDASFTPGNICSGGGDCYAEGENVPFRLTITDLTPSTPYSVRIQHDFQDSAGRDGYVNFNTPGTWDGSATGVGLSAPTTSAGLPNTKTYDLTFTTASAATVVQLKWFGLLGQDAGEWNGAQLHARLVQGVQQESIGNKEVPIQVTKIVIRNLSVTKTDNPDPIQLNATTTYTIVVTNSGEQDETVTVVDQLPSKLVYVNDSGSPAPSSVSGDSRTITWNGIVVTKNGGTRTLTFDARGVEVGTGTNEVTVTAPLLDPVSDTEDTTVLGQCELTITKAVNSQTANPGDILTYTLTYQNTGTANCTGGGVRIDDVIPSDTTYVNDSNTQSITPGTDTDGQGIDFGYDHNVFGSANPAGYNPATRLLSWDAEVVSPGESGTVTYQATVNQLPVCSDINIDNNGKIYADQIPNGVTSNTVRTNVTSPCNGHIIIDKVTNPSGDPQVFSFDASGGSYADFTLTDAQAPNDQALVAGTYSVSETVPAGWDQTSAACSDGSPVNAIVLSADETVTCTFTNTKKGHLIVQKTTDPAADPTVFSISASGTGTITGGGAGTVTDALDKNYEVTPGAYSVTETVPPGWSKTGDTCQGVPVAAGETKYCTLTNTRDTGFLTVNKMVDPENDGSFVGVGGDDTPFRWGVDALDGPTTPRYMGATAIGIPTVTPFNVNENLSDVPGYHFAGWYYTNDAAQLDNNLTYNCTTPQFTSMPTGLTVAKNGTTQITLCNARDTGDLTILKVNDQQQPQVNVHFTVNGIDYYTNGSGMIVLTGLPTDDYQVAEVQSPTGYSFSSVSGVNCTNSNPSTATVLTNTTTTCTFTNNRDMGQLTVRKQVVNDNGGTAAAGDFTMHIQQASVDSVAPFAGDENAIGANTFMLPTGTYDVSETGSLLTGGQYAQTSIICDGQPVSSITVTKNGQHDCLITNNDQAPSLTLIKNVITDNGGTAVPANWTLTATGPTTISGAGGATSGPTFKAGTYTLSESGGPAGYAASSWSCSNESEGNQVSVGLGESVTCTIANDDIQPKLTVTKVVVNNDGGTKTVSDFPLFVGSTQVTSGQQNGFNVGAYTVSETNQAGYVGTISGDCTAQGQVSLSPGGVKSCTITNDDQAAHLTVIKHVVNNSGGVKTAGDFTLNITGVTVPSGATFAGAESGVTKVVFPGAYNVTENTVSGYAASFSADCTGTIALGQTKTCTVTNDDALSTIGLTKTGPATAVPGTNFTYTLAWSVSGSNPVTNAVVSDAIPANTSFVSASCGTTTGTCTINSATSTVTWSLGSRNAGESGTVTLTVKLASPLANGTVIPNEGVFDTDQNEPVRSSITTIVQSAPSLSITKSNNISTFVNPGQSIIYTVVVTNTAAATETATDVTMTDVLPTGFTFIDGGGSTKSFSLGNLTPGQSVTTSYNVSVDAGQAAGTYTNTATAKGTNTASVSATSAVDVRVPQVLGATAAPSLSLTKSVTPKVTNPGKTVTFTVTIHNGGDADATNVVLTDTLPKGFTFAEDGSRTKTWNLGTLEANHDRVINYDVLVGKSVKAGTYKNLAVVAADGVSPISASRTVQVKVPAVLGLATTGVSTRDYVLFAFGLSILAAGLAWFSRLRRPHDQTSR